ncbi:hypothetical protein SAMN05421858_0601 [Haladaptatus litoreus]|uniref:Uncharacterized protein n=1 Tax=Haladaptatus litoreus TaxID=553468 RepID=A0A1N6W4Y4_9EURY|nr:hypothetical protein [Haladaptatus litoreus]SIQ85062.1 hypothetical protein SAMN05421858_0601 [Haladaptatus litoreus]
MDRRTFIERLGGAVAVRSGIVHAQRDDGYYRNPRVTTPLIQYWEVETRETNRIQLRVRGVDLGDAYATTLIYKDTRLTETLNERLRRDFDGIVGAFIATRITFESPLSAFAQPSLVEGLAKRRFERTARNRGFSRLRERNTAERETTREQATAEYDAYYSIGRYTETPPPNIDRFPGIGRDDRVKTVLYFDVSRSGGSLLLTTGVRPTNQLLQTVLNRDSDAYRRELLQLMHSVR